MTHLTISSQVEFISRRSQIELVDILHLRRKSKHLVLRSRRPADVCVAERLRGGKRKTGTNLRHDGRHVQGRSRVGEISQLAFISRGQDGDGFQGDVCLIEDTLDLTCVLCVTNGGVRWGRSVASEGLLRLRLRVTCYSHF